MIGRILFFVSLIAVSILPDNLADLAKFGDLPDVGKKPRNRVRGSSGGGRRRGHGHPRDERKLEPAIPPNPGDDDNDAIRENRSGGPAGGGGGEPHSASQGDPDGLIPVPPETPPDDKPAS